MNSLAPIALFVYNRQLHTEKVIEALKENKEAIYSDLFIFSDAGKNDDNIESVQQVRDYINTISGFKSITIKEQSQNSGLAKSIITGVTEIINNYGKIIVLEDDIVTSPFFLEFLNNGLDFYENEHQVWGITGRQYPIDSSKLPNAFFLDSISCTGWGTWKNKWNFFEKNSDKYLEKISHIDDIYRFNHYGSSDIYSQLKLNKTGKMNTWAIFWEAEVFLNKGLYLFPSKSLIQNIGFDNSGIHCDSFSITDCGELFKNKIDIDFNKITIEKNKLAIKRIRKFRINNYKTKPNMIKMLIRKILPEKMIIFLKQIKSSKIK